MAVFNSQPIAGASMLLFYFTITRFETKRTSKRLQLHPGSWIFRCGICVTQKLKIKRTQPLCYNFKEPGIARQARNQEGAGGDEAPPLEIFLPPVEKCVGSSLKTLNKVQKIWAPLGKLFAPPGGPKLVTSLLQGLYSQHDSNLKNWLLVNSPYTFY